MNSDELYVLWAVHYPLETKTRNKQPVSTKTCLNIIAHVILSWMKTNKHHIETCPKIWGQEPRAAQFRFGVATSPRKCMQLFWRGDQRTPSNSDPKVGCTGKGACYTSLLGTDETICGSYHWLVWNCLSQERSSWTSLIHGHVSSHWRGPKNLPSTSAGERGEAADAWEMPFFMLVDLGNCPKENLHQLKGGSWIVHCISLTSRKYNF